MQGLEAIEGVVSKVIFNGDNNYAVVAVRSEHIPQFAQNSNFPNSFVAVGNFTRIAEGQHLILKGKWSQTRYGWRFAVEEYEEVAPPSEEALIQYLSSKLFKGIGVKTAREIVKTFGQDTLKIIKTEPERLMDVKGISETKKNALVSAYRDHEHLEKLMLALKLYGVTNTRIIKIYSQYKEKALEILKENPYKLADDIHGFGFKTADQIARACQIDFKHPSRIKAAVLYVLKEAADGEGHLFLTRRSLLMRLKKLLNTEKEKITKEDILPVLEEMVQSQEVICDEEAYYLPHYYNAEVAVAHKIRDLLQTNPELVDIDVEKAIKEQEQKLGIRYAPKQKEAIRKIIESSLMVITGGPGTGKTTIIKGIIGIYRQYFPEKRIILTAPTGRASKRMEEVTGIEAKTIHRLLEFRPSGDGKICCMRDERNPIDGDLIIIDESSMIDLLLLNRFLKAVRKGTQVVFVGDADQLPSVGAGNVLKDLIESKKIPVIKLDEIFRQANTSRIVINANLINKGRLRLEYGNDFEFIEEDENECLPELIRDKLLMELKEVKDINKIQVLTPFRTRTNTGVDNLNRMLQEVLNPRRNSKEIQFGRKVFREKDKVMQFRNDYEKEVFNGEVGFIDRIGEDEDGVFAEIVMDDRRVIYRRDDFEDLDLAYATTIHKSQGSEYDIVIIPVTTQHYLFLQRNMIYTAITRAKKKVILIGSKKALAIAIRTNKVEERNSRLAQRI